MNAIPEPGNGVAERISRQTLARREAEYTSEVRRLLDAAIEVMTRCGTESRPRVADIVAAAGLSNEAFYRHFPSKDALVAAILEDGAQRLRSYLEHQMAKESTPEARVRRWVEGVLSQADEEIAASTLAVMWNGSSAGDGVASGRHFASAPLTELLVEPFEAMGSRSATLHASLAAHATLGKLSDYLWQGHTATAAEIDDIIEFYLSAVEGGPGPTRTTRKRNR